jgi:hypothetical protein
MGLLDDAIREHLDLQRRRGGDPAEIERAERDALGPVRRDPIASDAPADAGVGMELPPEPHDDWDEPPIAQAPVAEPPTREPEHHDQPSGGRSFFRRRARRAEPEPAPEPPLDPRTDLDPWDEEDDPYADQYAYEEDEFEIEPAGEPPDAQPTRPLASGPVPPAPAAPPPVAATPPPAEQEQPRVRRPAPVEPPPGAREEPAAPPEPPSHPAAGPSPEPPAAADRAAPTDDVLGETVEYDVESAFKEATPGKEDVLEETPEFLQDTPDHDRLWFEQRPPRDFDFDG